jgi:hypothetical protein
LTTVDDGAGAGGFIFVFTVLLIILMGAKVDVFISEVSSAQQMKVKNLVRHGKLRDEGCGCLLWFSWGGEFNQILCWRIF